MKKRTSATRVLEVLRVLKGHSLRGLSNGEIAHALGDTPVNITRALATLGEVGFVTRLDSGRYAPGIELAQIALAHLNELDRAERRLHEIKQRTLAGAM